MKWWENEFLKVQDHKLCLEGIPAVDIAKEYGTPLFVYSKRQIEANFNMLLGMFPDSNGLELRLHYAMKANPHPEILDLLNKKGAWIDAVSPEEVEFAAKQGFELRKILYTGTSVSRQDLERVLAFPDIVLNIDAAEQLELMRGLPNIKGRRVAVRINPGMGGGFNEKTVTAGSKGASAKFGIEPQKIRGVFERAESYGMKPIGLHQHLGSGWTEDDYSNATIAAKTLIEKADDLASYGYVLEFLDFGGGFSKRYREEERAFPIDEYFRFISSRIKAKNLSSSKIAFEPGRFLAADAGVMLMDVVYVKESFGKHFVCVNAGTFNSVPRPAIYSNAHHHILNCRDTNSFSQKNYTVAGHLCEAADVFAADIKMPYCIRGDTLAVLMAGAYCSSMATPRYNMRPVPKEIFI